MTPTIAQRIRAVRVSRRMTMRQLAAAIGRTETVIYDIENGRRFPDETRLAAICTALGVTVKEIQSPHWRSLCARGGVGLEEAL